MNGENITKRLIAWAVLVAFILMIPLVAMQFSNEWDWGFSDFAFAGAVLFGAALAYEFMARKVNNVAYRFAVGVAMATAVLLVWVNAAAGIIGGGDLDSPNGMYFGVLAVGVVGAFIARFKPHGMSVALFVTAVAQFLVPVFALIFFRSDFAPGVVQVFILNGIFVAAFVGAGVLFHRAGIRKLHVNQ